MRAATCVKGLLAAVAFAFGVPAFMATGAAALEEGKDEKAQLEACERVLCGIVVKREANGGDLQCALQKTWAGRLIKEGVEKSNKLKWGFGDVRCSVNLQAKRQELIDALGKPQFELKLAKHAIRCEVEREKEVMPLSLALAPRFQFKDGQAVKAWLGIGEIEAPPALKSALWTVAQLEDTFGIVHADLIKEINRFVHKRCPKRAS
jgi:hypothetical protein